MELSHNSDVLLYDSPSLRTTQSAGIATRDTLRDEIDLPTTSLKEVRAKPRNFGELHVDRRRRRRPRRLSD